jgi:hypothetical protein
MNNSPSKNLIGVGRVISNAPRLLLLFLASLAIGVSAYAQSTGLYVNSSNHVGIGTTSPVTNLQVGSGTFSTVALPGIGIANGPSSYSFFSASDNTHQYIAGIDNTLSYGKEGMVSNHDLAIETNNTPRIYITNAGNVGIGTTTPSLPLDVKGANLVARFESTAASALIYFTPSGQKQWRIGAGSVNAGDFGIRNDTDGIEAINISAAGNVGIGTTNPQWPLDVSGSGARVTNGNGNAAQFDLVQTNGGHDWALCSWGSAAGGGSLPNKFSIYDNTIGAHRLVIDGNGNVGIDTTAPQYPLDVAGQVHATSFVASSGNNYADFVFKPGYKLEPLSDVEASIRKDGHLPGIPSEAEAKAHGINLADMQVKLLQKIEELTLHQIDQEKRIEQLEKENAELLEKLTK